MCISVLARIVCQANWQKAGGASPPGRKPVSKRMRRTLKRIKEELRRRMHNDVDQTARWLGRVLYLSVWFLSDGRRPLLCQAQSSRGWGRTGPLSPVRGRPCPRVWAFEEDPQAPTLWRQPERSPRERRVGIPEASIMAPGPFSWRHPRPATAPHDACLSILPGPAVEVLCRARGGGGPGSVLRQGRYVTNDKEDPRCCVTGHATALTDGRRQSRPKPRGRSKDLVEARPWATPRAPRVSRGQACQRCAA